MTKQDSSSPTMHALSFNASLNKRVPPPSRLLFSVASPGGDLSVTDDDLQVKLEGCALHTTYGTYFAAIREVLCKDNFQVVQAVVEDLGRDILPDQIHVRAEKHGALYHPSSLELTWPDAVSAKYALLVAITPAGQEALRRESLVLGHLHATFDHSYLPKTLCCAEHGKMTFLLAPWFSGFHEFHAAASGGFCLWDHDQGLRSIPVIQARQVFFQVARILTLYLDSQNGACLHPWSHAAGDFIVRMDEKDVDVRLSTARGYEPFETDNQLSALFAFVLDMALRMRLDRVDGVGEWTWLEDDVLENAINGFYAAIAERGGGEAPLNVVARVLPSFSEQELVHGHAAILEAFSPGELAVIVPRLEIHCRELAKTLHRTALAKQPG